MQREQLAWVAGFFDGEGHIGWGGPIEGKHRNRIYLDVSQAGIDGPPDTLLKIKECVGFGVVRGPYGPYKNKNRKPIYRYELAGIEKVQAFYAMVYPWLGEAKRKNFEDALSGWKKHHRPRGWRPR